MIPTMNEYGLRGTLREFLHNGKRVKYDACSDDTLEKAREFYTEARYELIGQGQVYFINGVENRFDKIHLFFKLKTAKK